MEIDYTLRLYNYFMFIEKNNSHTEWYPINTNNLSIYYNNKCNYKLLEEFGKNFLSQGLNTQTYWLHKDDAIYKEFIEQLKQRYICITNGHMKLEYKNIGKLMENNNMDKIVYPLNYKWGLDVNYLQNKINNTNHISLEIGAGFGGFANIYFTNTSVKKYFIVDIPTTSMVSGFFLLNNEHDIVFENEIENIYDIINNNKKQIIFISPSYLLNLPENFIDIVINMDSMVEMNEPTISFYLIQIKRILKNNGYFWNSNCSKNKKYPYLFQNINDLFYITHDFYTEPLINEKYDYDKSPERFNYNFTMDMFYRNILCSK